MGNAGLDEHKLESRLLREIPVASDMQMWHHPYGRKWRGTEEPLDESERGEWKSGLKLNIQETKVMASSPITSWQIDGETVGTMADFIFMGSKITAGGDCCHKIKRCLLLGRKVMSNLDNILKSRDITLPTKVHLVKATVFPVVMYGCESWTIKKAECQRIDAFELWCWRKLLRVPWTARRCNQSNPKEDQSWVFIGRADVEAERPILWPPDAKSWLIWKDPDAGKDWGQEEKRKTEDEVVGWHHQLDGHGFGWTLGVDDWQGGLVCCSSWGGRVRQDWVTELNWTPNLYL